MWQSRLLGVNLPSGRDTAQRTRPLFRATASHASVCEPRARRKSASNVSAINHNQLTASKHFWLCLITRHQLAAYRRLGPSGGGDITSTPKLPKLLLICTPRSICFTDQDEAGSAATRGPA